MKNVASAPSARGVLSPELIERLARLLVPDAAIVCMGNELRGDDAAGVLVGRRLGAVGPWNVYNVRNAPENFLFLIADRRPAAVLVIDAMDFGAEPGAVTLIQGAAVTGQGPGTHGPSPAAFLELLAQVHPCETAVLGIQPGRCGTAEPLSGPVAAAVENLAAALAAIADNLRPRGAGPSP